MNEFYVGALTALGLSLFIGIFTYWLGNSMTDNHYVAAIISAFFRVPIVILLLLLLHLILVKAGVVAS